MKSGFNLFFVALFSFVAGTVIRDYIMCKEYKDKQEEMKLYDDESFLEECDE